MTDIQLDDLANRATSRDYLFPCARDFQLPIPVQAAVDNLLMAAEQYARDGRHGSWMALGDAERKLYLVMADLRDPSPDVTVRAPE